MTGLLLDHLWQSTLFAAAAGLAALAMRTNAAAIRFWLWFAAAAKFLIPFAAITGSAAWLASRLHAQTPAPPAIEAARQALGPITAPAAAQVIPPFAHAPHDKAPWLAALWTLGSAAIILWRLIQWRGLRACLAQAEPIALPAPLPAVAAPTRGGPAVTGLLRPLLVLPAGLAERLTPAELGAVLEHELQHARRRDNLLAIPLLAAQTLFWFHPMIWWIGRRMLAEREQACDEAVVRSGTDPETYARGLLQACRFQVQRTPAIAAGMTGADLKQRIRRIMADRPARPLGPAGYALLTAAVTVAIGAPVAAGLFATPAARRLLLTPVPRAIEQIARVARPTRAEVAAPLTPPPARIAPAPQKALLIAPSEPGLQPEPLRLMRQLAGPVFEPERAAAPTAEPDYATAPAGVRSGLLEALASRTAYVIEGGVWGPRLELRTGAGRACPNAQVARAETALGQEAISTAFDAAVRRFVDDTLEGRPAPRDLSPAMARAVDSGLPSLQPALARTFGPGGHARLLGEDTQERDVYLVRRDGRSDYALVAVNDLGQIESALFCTRG